MVSWLATAWSTRSLCSPVNPGFLCAEPDQAFLSATVFQLGSNPVQSTGNSTAIIGVLVAVKRFKQQHPLVGTEMNGLSWLSHEWVRCLWWIVPVRF